MNVKNDTTVALIGLGMVSATYVDALAKTISPTRLKGVLSSREETAQRFLDTHYEDSAEPRPIIYRDVAAIAADPEIDFVLLTTPPDAREELLTTLVQAGKPVLMEKPVERSLESATRLCEICEAREIPLGIMLQHRARPSAQELLAMVQQDATGPLQAVEISVPWWREQAYYDEPGRGSYARDGGGVMISQAIHTLDLALQYAGPVVDVMALTATTGFHTMEAEDFVSAGLRFASGAVGSVFSSTASYPGRTETIVLHFARVSATLESSLLILNWQDGRQETLGTAVASGAGANPMAFTSDWHRFMIENFTA
nr:Gfo/Idh/MocA family oxidoreductase [Gammaproteobacteria bacterium]